MAGADVIVVGAGIVGTACAAELAQAGMKVMILDPNVAGSGATAAGMGHLVVMDGDAAELALTAYSLELWKQFVLGDVARHEYQRCGTIWVAADAGEMDIAGAKVATLSQHGIRCRLLSANALYELEPHLRQGLAGGVIVEDDGIVFPAKSAQLLLELACVHGASLLNGTVSHIGPSGVSMADGTELEAHHIVIAAGSDSGRFIPEFGMRMKKGHLVVTDRYPGLIHHQLVELGYIKTAHSSDGDSVAFNVQPRPDGHLLIGSSRQFDNHDNKIDLPVLQKMLSHAVSYLPELSTLHAIRSWTGFRAASPDGLPLIGPHPTRATIWLATGHEGLGITTSLATARLLTAQMLGTASAISVEPFLPSRISL